MTLTLADALAGARSRLAAAGFADAPTDVRVLVCGLFDLTPTDLVLRGDRVLSSEEMARLDAALARRLAHEPVHRILGERDFHGVRLLLSKDTLEPRPDTEILVDAMLAPLKRIVAQKGSARLLDLGTGTGAIAITLLSEVPQLFAIGADIAAGALETARRNADLNGVGDRFTAVESHWFDRIEGLFDIIVSNPPYINSSVIADLSPDVRDFDPMLALDGGTDGLDAYRAIAAGASVFLAADGVVGLEIGFDQKSSVSTLFAAHDYTLIEALSDYGGNDRALVFARKNHYPAEP
ncbi:peptide chain release factor N(5)-glutamine methyltransferase [Rhizobium sp. SGZ-381]|uniref:peptide chain release factor N(5)-glutamine methyltransferase n=1 Tax=Rhizobium sp. SGZ-381 TaxID=3342800 RepID=UPI0036723A8B